MNCAANYSCVLLTGDELIAGSNVHGILTGALSAGRSETNGVFWETRRPLCFTHSKEERVRAWVCKQMTISVVCRPEDYRPSIAL